MIDQELVMGIAAGTVAMIVAIAFFVMGRLTAMWACVCRGKPEDMPVYMAGGLAAARRQPRPSHRHANLDRHTGEFRIPDSWRGR